VLSQAPFEFGPQRAASTRAFAMRSDEQLSQSAAGKPWT
jgi:hypothetical protein